MDTRDTLVSDLTWMQKLKQKTGGKSLAYFFFYYLSENKPPKKPPNYLKAFVTLFSKTSKC